MEIRELAERILLSESIDEKLSISAATLTDDRPGEPVRVEMPARPPGLRFESRRSPAGSRSRSARMPHSDSFDRPHCRATALHIFANHELQALEVMAWVLCAFPDAPTEFRRQMIPILRDEQRHTRMYLGRILDLGLQFGDRRVNGYVWNKTAKFASILDYVAAICLTFEAANLDYSLYYAELFSKAGDERSAAVMRQIHADEIEHVGFGVEWLRRLAPPEMSEWDAYVAHLHYPLTAHHARSEPFHRDARLRAGMTPQFVDALQQQSKPD